MTRRDLIVVVVLVLLLVASIVAVTYVGSTNSQNQQSVTLNVYPATLKGQAIAGQHVVYLVTVSGESVQDKMAISADATNSSVLVQPEAIGAGEVAEITVIPDVSAVGQNVTVNISAHTLSNQQSIKRSVNFTVAAGEDTISDKARQLRDIFVQWLQENHPELGITNQTQWSGTIVSPVWLVVSHYLFFSKNWEMHVYWHIMIPPYDWARIDLRPRFTQLTPTLSFEISSVNSSSAPIEITPPNATWR